MPTNASKDKFIAAIGGFTGILLVSLVSHALVGEAPVMVASMGASAVLLFAVPQGPLSQPWPLAGGHLLSALVGVTCAQFVEYGALAAALAVGGSIGIMHLAHCVHPPGGATALSAVIGGERIMELGYSYLVIPILLNVVVILTTAIVFNALFKWRKYPVCWYCRQP